MLRSPDMSRRVAIACLSWIREYDADDAYPSLEVRRVSGEQKLIASFGFAQGMPPWSCSVRTRSERSNSLSPKAEKDVDLTLQAQIEESVAMYDERGFPLEKSPLTRKPKLAASCLAAWALASRRSQATGTGISTGQGLLLRIAHVL